MAPPVGEYRFGPDARIRTREDAPPEPVVDGEPIPPMWFTGFGGRREYLEALGAAGIRVFFVSHRVAHPIPHDPHALLDERVRRILDAVPDAYIFLRTGLNASEEWMRNNPDELIQFADGSPMPTWLGTECIQALCSARWRRDYGAALEELLSYLEHRPWAARVIGFFLCAGGTGEWYIPGTVVHEGDRTIDHSPAFRENFERVLRETYADEDALRAAWADTGATFASPKIPSAADHYVLCADAEMHDAFARSGQLPLWPEDESVVGSFLNPDTHRHVADYYRAVNTGAADSIIHFARLLKNATAATKLVGAFYGSFASPYTGTATGTDRILDSGAVDFLAAPGNYENRWPGGLAGQREMQDSFRIRGRIFVVEEDTRSSLMGRNDDWGVNTIRRTVEVMKRDFGRNLGEDLNAWWFDMASEGGWYDHPKLLDLMARQQEVARAFYRRRRCFTPEIALMYDRESLLHTSGGTILDAGLRSRNWEIPRIGAPVAYHYTEDLGHDAMPEYALLVFMNHFVVPDDTRRMIRAYLKRTGCTALWMYAPGVINPDCTDNAFDGAHIRDLIGFDVAVEQRCAEGFCRLTDAGAAALPGMPRDRDEGWFDRYSVGTVVAHQPQGPAECTLLSPYVRVHDPEAETLMRFVADDEPALARKQSGARCDWYAAFKAIGSPLLREIARASGCHIYGDSDDVLYVGGDFLTIHASSSGEKVIRLPRPSQPWEIYERRSYGIDTDIILCRMRTGETKTFHLHGEI